jgi:hypothetical protein
MGQYTQSPDSVVGFSVNCSQWHICFMSCSPSHVIHNLRLITGNFPRRTGEFANAILDSLKQRIANAAAGSPVAERVFMPGERYLLKTPTLAIASQDDQNRPATKYSVKLLGSTAQLVPLGAVVKLIDGCLDGNRLVDVEWEGKTIMMFTTDIRERCERLNDDALPTPITG